MAVAAPVNGINDGVGGWRRGGGWGWLLEIGRRLRTNELR
jgi:hypothetical protein